MLKLGILYKNDKIVNHRSLLKILINPILRYFGYYIASIFDGNKFCGLKIYKGQKTTSIEYDLTSCNDYDFIKKIRRVF